MDNSIITCYVNLYLAQSYNKFYHDNAILVEDEKVKEARLAIVLSVKYVLSNALYLLGIKCLS